MRYHLSRVGSPGHTGVARARDAFPVCQRPLMQRDRLLLQTRAPIRKAELVARAHGVVVVSSQDAFPICQRPLMKRDRLLHQTCVTVGDSPVIANSQGLRVVNSEHTFTVAYEGDEYVPRRGNITRLASPMSLNLGGLGLCCLGCGGGGWPGYSEFH